MSTMIDRAGCFRGIIQEHGVGASKNGFPQLAVSVMATKKWVDDPTEFEAFGLTEPGWVDWEYDARLASGYINLAHTDKKTQELVASFQVEPVRRATGWDGASYAGLAALALNGQEITFWMDWNEYDGKTNLRMDAIDAADAAPTRSLRSLDADGLKNLDAKFASILATKPTAAAKAPAKATPAGKPTPGKSAAAPAPKAPAAPSAATPTTAASPAKSASPSKAPPSKGPPKPAAPKPPAEEAPFATSMTMAQAWEALQKATPKASDEDQTNAWLAACTEVAPGLAEDAITNEQWSEIAAAAIKAVSQTAV